MEDLINKNYNIYSWAIVAGASTEDNDFVVETLLNK